MRLTDIVQKWLTAEEWNETPEIAENSLSSSTSFKFNAGEFVLDCFFEADEELEVFKFYAYFFGIKIPEAKSNEIINLCADISRQMLVGNLQYIVDEQVVRFYGSIDVENASFEEAHITNLMNNGISNMKNRLPEVLSICYAQMGVVQ